MTRCPAFALSFAFVALAPTAAWAAAADCPDGWFCDEAGSDAAPPVGVPPRARPEPGPPGPPPEAPSELVPPSYPPPAESDDDIWLDRPETAAPPPPVRRRHGLPHPWGFNLHLEGAVFGQRAGRASHSGMGGLGFSFRYRPLPALALDAGVDLLTGKDFNGYSRTEAGLLLNALVFFNPHDVAQFYALGGLGFSGANVTIAPRGGEAPFVRHDESYSYFGARAGVGLEVHVQRGVALNGEVLGLIRGRTDDQANRVPEFEDPNTHRVSNTSGAGLFRAGITFYW